MIINIRADRYVLTLVARTHPGTITAPPPLQELCYRYVLLSHQIAIKLMKRVLGNYIAAPDRRYIQHLYQAQYLLSAKSANL